MKTKEAHKRGCRYSSRGAKKKQKQQHLRGVRAVDRHSINKGWRHAPDGHSAGHAARTHEQRRIHTCINWGRTYIPNVPLSPRARASGPAALTPGVTKKTPGGGSERAHRPALVIAAPGEEGSEEVTGRKKKR